MTIYYTYRLQHPDGRFYIGSRASKVSPYSDLGIRYFSSSKYVKQIGFENFYFGVVCNGYQTHNECWRHEQKLIEENIKNPLCLNRHYISAKTGSSVFSTQGRVSSRRGQASPLRGRKLTENHKAKLSLAFKGKSKKTPVSEEHRQKLSESATGRRFDTTVIERARQTRQATWRAKREATIYQMRWLD